MRRSFRFAVTACVAFTTMLWLSERYLRYDLTKSQYIMALTLEPESARPVLRQVVKRDGEQREFPSPKYLAALAEREEADLILPTYERAYKLDPDDSFLAVRYGCRLFLAEKYAEARERFREARLQPPTNALPGYLEAAALQFSDGTKKDVSESLALVARTNSSSDAVLFPQPLWAENLPRRGMWFSKLRRHITDECCAPLYKYSDWLVNQARHRITLRQVQYWDSWLETLQEMGERLAVTGDPGSVQMTAGVHIQLAALEQRLALPAAEGRTADPELVERQRKLTSSLALLNQFEAGRDEQIAADRARYVLPLTLCWKSVAVAFLFYLISWGGCRILRVGRKAWTLPHSRFGKSALLGSSGGLLALLLAISVLQHTTPPRAESAGGSPESGQIAAGGVTSGLVRADGLMPVRWIWWLVLGTGLALGLAYPYGRLSPLTAPSDKFERDASSVHEETRPERESERESVGAEPACISTAHPPRLTAEPQPPGWRRIVYVSFMHRYYGILCGLLLCVISFWAIGYRVSFSLYPWQIELLTTGLQQEEAQAVQEATALLR